MSNTSVLYYLFSAFKTAFVTISKLWTWCITSNSYFNNMPPIVFIAGASLITFITVKIVLHFFS